MVRDLNGTSAPEAETPGSLGGAPAVNGPDPESGSTDAEEPSRQRTRTDDSHLSGKGRVALPPVKRTSRHNNTYVTVRLAQNVRLIGNDVHTHFLDLLCFGGAASIAERLVVGQTVHFRGTFGQVEYQPKNGGVSRLSNQVVIDYLDPGPRPAPRD